MSRGWLQSDASERSREDVISTAIEDISLLDQQLGFVLRFLAENRAVGPAEMETAARKIRASRECLQDARIGLVSFNLSGR